MSNTAADLSIESPRFRLSRWSRSFSLWLVIAFLLGIVGWYKTINLLLLLAYLFAALLLLNLWLAWRMLHRVRIERLPTPPVFPNEVAAVRFDVRNPSSAPANLLLTDVADGRCDAWLLAPLGPRESRRLTARWCFPRRGCYPIGPMIADSSYPFGIARLSKPIAENGKILVLPSIGEVDLDMFRRWLIRGGSADTNQRKPTRRPSTGQGDVRGLRPYREGDSPRDVHWKTSARRGQLLVREYDQPEPLDLILIVDPWLPPNPTQVQRDHLEWALSLTMTLGESWCRLSNSAQVTLVVPGDPPIVESGRASPGLARRAFHCLAELTGTASIPTISMAEIRRRGGRSARIIVSSRPHSPLVDSLRASGMPFRSIDPSHEPAWYREPES